LARGLPGAFRPRGGLRACPLIWVTVYVGHWTQSMATTEYTCVDGGFL
jgi:hypothetical protein